jgi:hypothetical protein
VDWDGNGTADNRDEWIELYNAGSTVVDLSGWFLDDAEGDSTSYRIPAGTVLQPGAFAVFYRQETGLTLNDDGDEGRLLKPNGDVMDAVVFGELATGASYSRGRQGTWHANWPPSPGAPNIPPRPKPNPGQSNLKHWTEDY